MALTTSLLLGASASHVEELLQQGIELSIVGVVVVFGALIAIMIMLGALQKIGMATTAPPPAPVAAPVVAPGRPADLSPELVAVITAAAIAAVGQPIRVRRIRFAGTATNPTWAETGRRDIHTSHRLRKRDS